jgi:primosomal protein N''
LISTLSALTKEVKEQSIRWRWLKGEVKSILPRRELREKKFEKSLFSKAWMINA